MPASKWKERGPLGRRTAYTRQDGVARTLPRVFPTTQLAAHLLTSLRDQCGLVNHGLRGGDPVLRTQRLTIVSIPWAS